MIILRILWGIIAIPLIIIAYVLKFFFYLLTLIGGKIITIIAGLAACAGIIIIAVQLFACGAYDVDWSLIWTAIGLIVGGGIIYFIPYIGVFIVDLIDAFIDWVKYTAFGR